MKSKITILLLFIFAISAFSKVSAQQKADSLPNDYKRNVVKWNMTPFILWSSSNLNFSYERVLRSDRTFSVNAGYFVLPTSGVYDNLKIETAKKKSGYSFSGDYRFYFKNRNTGMAPDGLYWGPYGSFHHYQFTNDFEVLEGQNSSGNLTFDGNFNVISLGIQLGYQFVIKERLTVDLIFMGPSASVYNASIGLEGNIEVGEEDEYLKAIRDVLVSKFPFLDELLDKREFNTSGVTTGLGPGLRYMIQIGYRF